MLRRLLTTLGMCCAAQAQAQGERLYIDYSPKPRLTRLTLPTTCILDPHAKVDLKAAQAKGHVVLAYISLVELAKGSPGDATAQKAGVPFVGTNEAWDSHLMDVSSDAWRHFILEHCAAQAGFDGFFFDTLDSVEHLTPDSAVKREKANAALVAMLRTIHERWPQKRLVVNRGFALLPRLRPFIHGLLVESVYQSFDPATKRYQPVKPEDSAWLEQHIRTALADGLTVYAVDYTAPADRKLALKTAARLQQLGCVPLVTTHGLTGDVIAPVIK